MGLLGVPSGGEAEGVGWEVDPRDDHRWMGNERAARRVRDAGDVGTMGLADSAFLTSSLMGGGTSTSALLDLLNAYALVVRIRFDRFVLLRTPFVYPVARIPSQISLLGRRSRLDLA